MTKTYKSDIKAAIHQTASDLHEAGLINKQTMRRFDKSCLTPVRDFTANDIRALREREAVSQTVFARYLNVPRDSVSQWERGDKHPSGPSLKLLSLVEKNGLGAIA
ncbi:MAG: DNA-binding transcriptional regulator [Magnetococcus sp. YQC-3]